MLMLRLRLARSDVGSTLRLRLARMLAAFALALTYGVRSAAQRGDHAHETNPRCLCQQWKLEVNFWIDKEIKR